MRVQGSGYAVTETAGVNANSVRNHPAYAPVLLAKNIRGWVVIFLTILSWNTKGQEKNSEIIKRLDEYCISANNAYRFNGSVLVSHKGEVLLNKGYGLRDMTGATPNTPETRFPILSVTKTFTAALILKLQEEKKLSVDDNLAMYLPDYPNASKIKIHHLLTHSSGIYDYTTDVGIEDSAIVNHPISKDNVVNHFKNKPLEFDPGKNYQYSNSGYFLLGLIIEKITGKPYETVVREKFFTPLGMTESGFDFINLPNAIRAKGYELWTKDRLVPYKHYDSTFAYSAGSIYSTTTDLLKWSKAISARQILNGDTWAEAFEPRIANYGYGWQTGKFLGKKYVKHSGGYPGFMSEFIYYPDEDLTIILLNNFGNYDENIWAVGMGISCIAFQLPYDNWDVRQKVMLKKEAMQKRVGKYQLKFMNGKSMVNIKVKGDSLFLDIEGMELPLYAENENHFFLEYFNAQLIFEGEKGTFHSHGLDGDLIKK